VGAIFSPTEAGTPTLRDTRTLYGSGLMRTLTLDDLLLHLFLKIANKALQSPEPLGAQSCSRLSRWKELDVSAPRCVRFLMTTEM
jgi:hypothetical protein